MPADYSYIPVAEAPGPDPRLADVRLAPSLDTTPIQTQTVNEGLNDFYGIRKAQRQDVAEADADRLRKATVKAVGPGANQFDIADLEEYRARFGSLPTDPVTGQVDMNQVRQKLTAQKQIELALGTQAMQAKATGGAYGVPKPEDALKVQESQSRIDQSIGEAEQALELIKSGNYVGPLTGSGAGQLWHRGQAVRGNEETYNAQRQLQIILNRNILDKAALMKGQLSDRDVKFLEASVPKLTDTEAVWESYFNKLKLLASEQKRRNEAFLRGEMSLQEKNTPITDDPNWEAKLGGQATASGQAADPSALPEGSDGQIYPMPDANGNTKPHFKLQDGSFVPATREQIQRVMNPNAPAPGATGSPEAPKPGLSGITPQSVQRQVAPALGRGLINYGLNHPLRVLRGQFFEPANPAPATVPVQRAVPNAGTPGLPPPVLPRGSRL